MKMELTEQEHKRLFSSKYEDEIHFFGEMDLDLSFSADDVYKRAFSIAENCGYMVDINNTKRGNQCIELYPLYGSSFYLFFDEEGKFMYCVRKGENKRYTIVDFPAYHGYKGGF